MRHITIPGLFLAVFLISILSVSVLAGEFFLKQNLFEGESTEYDVEGYKYEVTLLAVFDTQLKAQFEVNGEKLDPMGEDESEKLSDGAVIQVRSILPQEAGDGKDLVQFNFFPAEHEAVEQVVVDVEEAAPPVQKEEPEPDVIASEKTITAAPERQDSKVDVTRTKPNVNWWDSLLKWLKGLFK